MRRAGVRRWARGAPALAAAATALLLAGCPGAGGAGGAGSGGGTGPDAIEKRNYEAVLDDALCPCGAPHTLRACLGDHADCAARAPAARMAKRLVSDGLARTEIVEAISKRFATRPVALDLAETPCKGAAEASVTVVEFADFECPHCKVAAALWKPLLEKYPSALKVCFKHYPLPSHPNAEIAARAAVVAARAGKFWEMHDLIFENAEKLSVDLLQSLARGLGFEDDAFLSEMTTEEAKAKVAADKDQGELAGVVSTPTLFVNGIKFTERRRVEVLSAWIEDAMAAAPRK